MTNPLLPHRPRPHAVLGGRPVDAASRRIPRPVDAASRRIPHSHRPRHLAVLGGLVLGMLCCPPPGAAAPAPPPASQAAAPDFHTEVAPLLRRYCLRCHSAADAKGDLRLDNAAAAMRGGHTGRPVLTGGRESSELFRRISTADADLAMPRDAPRLSAAERDLLGRWLDAGAAWPAAPPQALGTAGGRSEGAMAEMFRNLAEQLLGPASWGAAGVLLTLLLLLAAERARGAVAAARPARLLGWLAWYRPSHLALLLAALGLAELWRRERENNDLLRQTGEELRKELEAQREARLGPRRSANSHAQRRLQHPRRLGGEYYRGNDERSERLFNGGFYRTATFRLSLCNAQRAVLAAGDAPGPGPWYVRLEIERAAGAATGLFVDETMCQNFLSRQLPTNVSAPAASLPADAVSLQVAEPGNRWEAYYPLTIEPRLPLAGELYMVGERGSAQDLKYVIGYDLRPMEGGLAEVRLAEDCDLWLAPVGDFTRMVERPSPGKIPLAEWFDFRPIPEIMGENSADPELLGLPDPAAGH